MSVNVGRPGKVRLVLDENLTAFVSDDVTEVVPPAAIAQSVLLSDLRAQEDVNVELEVPLTLGMIKSWVSCARLADVHAETPFTEDSLSHISAPTLLEALKATDFLRSDTVVQAINQYFERLFPHKRLWSRKRSNAQGVKVSGLPTPTEEHRARAIRVLSELPRDTALQYLAPPRREDAPADTHPNNSRHLQLASVLMLMPRSLHHAVLRAWFPSVEQDGSLCLDLRSLPDFYSNDNRWPKSCLAALLLAAAALPAEPPSTAPAPTPDPPSPACASTGAAPPEAGGASSPRPSTIPSARSAEQSPKLKQSRTSAAAEPIVQSLQTPACPAPGPAMASPVNTLAERFRCTAQLTCLHLKAADGIYETPMVWRLMELVAGEDAAQRRGDNPTWYTALAQLQHLRHLHLEAGCGVAQLQVRDLLAGLTQLPALRELRLGGGPDVTPAEHRAVKKLISGLTALTRLSGLVLRDIFWAERARFELPVCYAMSDLTCLTQLTELRFEWRGNYIDQAWVNALARDMLALPFAQDVILGRARGADTNADYVCVGARCRNCAPGTASDAAVSSSQRQGGGVEEITAHGTWLEEDDDDEWRDECYDHPRSDAVRCASILAETLRKTRTLRKLDVSALPCGDKGLRAIADALPCASALSELRVGRNGEGHEGLLAVLRAAQQLWMGGAEGLRLLEIDSGALAEGRTAEVATCVDGLREGGLRYFVVRVRGPRDNVHLIDMRDPTSLVLWAKDVGGSGEQEFKVVFRTKVGGERGWAELLPEALAKVPLAGACD